MALRSKKRLSRQAGRGDHQVGIELGRVIKQFMVFVVEPPLIDAYENLLN
ncbi:MAG: hypothetical protein KDB00_12380 [Planctomycetales bacterium]|nr:hypothetical protein [Planctomycetales bacterium]